jgi:uncharacterized protein (UPF0262 family)
VAEPRTRLIDIQLDHDTIAHARPDFARDCKTAIADLLRDNSFALIGDDGGPYKLRIGTEEGRLLFDVSGGKQHPLRRVRLPLKPFARVIKDYIELCEMHYDAMRNLSRSRIEAMDMGRRGLHNEGAELLRERLAQRIGIDLETARRLFTLICALHLRG